MAPVGTAVEAGSGRCWESLRAALVVAHPGHELRVHHWLERARPLVLVLTDGSGHTDCSRLPKTTALIERAGATPGPIYGRLSDQELYRAILAGDVDLFSALADEIAKVLTQAQVEYVVGDAVEGVNPGHDVCRLLINAALSRIEAMNGSSLRNLEFLLEGSPHDCPAQDRADAIVLDLGEDAFRRKFDAARSYLEIATDITRTMGSHDLDGFRVECLRPVRYGLDIGQRFEHPAIYEAYGEKQVAAGIYREVIRFREHLAPLSERLGAVKARSSIPYESS